MKTDTPETDAAIALANDRDGAPEVCDLCEKLERERDEAIAEATNAVNDIIVIRARLQSEIDELKSIIHDPRFARFGEAMWKYITKMGGDFCGDEISEDILPLAQAAGLCCRVEYDPEIHGENIEADPGDEIWWWGDSQTNAKRIHPHPQDPQ